MGDGRMDGQTGGDEDVFRRGRECEWEYVRTAGREAHRTTGRMAYGGGERAR